jgi:hypothetical protein
MPDLKELKEPAEKKYTYEEWRAEGERRFGKDQMNWKFVCPVCKHVQSTTDYKNAGAPSDVVGFSCVGRWLPECRDAFGLRKPRKGDKKGKEGPCNYAGGGLFRINPVTVLFPDQKSGQFFDFAPADPPKEGS